MYMKEAWQFACPCQSIHHLVYSSSKNVTRTVMSSLDITFSAIMIQPKVSSPTYTAELVVPSNSATRQPYRYLPPLVRSAPSVWPRSHRRSRTSFPRPNACKEPCHPRPSTQAGPHVGVACRIQFSPRLSTAPQ